MTQLRKDFFGYAMLLCLIFFLAATHLVSMAVYFIFLYLLTDVVTNDLNRRFPALPKALLFWSFFVIVLALLGIAVFAVVPLFVKDVPLYFSLIRDNALQFVHTMAARFDIGIDDSAIKTFIVSHGSTSFGIAVKMVNGVSKEIVYFLFAFVLNVLLFLEKGAIGRVFKVRESSLLEYLYTFCSMRFKRFYLYFRKVMVGQFFISLINTSITLVVILSLNLPHKVTLLCIVFFCGLLPIIGNLISNAILSVTALISIGIPAFVICLVMLIGLHKLEYFLNGKIIGSIISLPMFVTVLSLLAGEATLGIFGMIIAIPCALTIRDELSGIDY
jgi:predicted PurR-regulated permease PerM